MYGGHGERVRFEWNEKEKSHCGMIRESGKWVFIDPPVKISAEQAEMVFPVSDSGGGFKDFLEEQGWVFEELD